MDETANLLRGVFQTSNRATFLPATGGSAMDAALINLLEPGNTVVVGRSGFFAERMLGIARRLHDVNVITIDSPWGETIAYETLAHAVREHHPRVLALVHGETSTGVEQPLCELGLLCHETDTLLVVDAVASLGGTPLPVDDLGIDVCYSGSQKCLSAPPGCAPITLLTGRSKPSSAQDAGPIVVPGPGAARALLGHRAHLSPHRARAEHLRAARGAALLLEEGLDARMKRHRLHARALRAGLEAMGMRLFADRRID